jgi:exodeoxyribonuclease VII small subunit
MSDVFDAAIPNVSLPANPANPRLPPDWNYEATVAKVEAIISRIETGELELADVFDQFATAVEHLRQCEAFLIHHQQQMDLLVETILDEEF